MRFLFFFLVYFNNNIFMGGEKKSLNFFFLKADFFFLIQKQPPAAKKCYLITSHIVTTGEKIQYETNISFIFYSFKKNQEVCLVTWLPCSKTCWKQAGKWLLFLSNLDFPYKKHAQTSVTYSFDCAFFLSNSRSHSIIFFCME